MRPAQKSARVNVIYKQGKEQGARNFRKKILRPSVYVVAFNVKNMFKM